MKYGSFETIKPIETHEGKTLYLGGNNTSQAYAIKVFDLAHFTHGDPEKTEVFNNIFYGSVEQQRKAAAVSGFIAPVFEYGANEQSAWVVTKLYSTSLDKLLEENAALTKENVFLLINSITQGCLDIKDVHGRPHGDLKPSNVLISTRKNQIVEVVVSDPAPGDGHQSEKFELSDLRAIGQMLYRIVHRYDTAGGNTVKISINDPAPQWQVLFGNDAKAWATICHRLLSPDLSTTHSYSLEKLALDLLKLNRSKGVSGNSRTWIAAAAGLVVLGAIAGIVISNRSDNREPAIIPPKSAPAQPSVEIQPTPDTEKNAQAETERLTAQRKAVEDRARLEAETKRLAAEKAAIQVAAQKAAEEARIRHEAEVEATAKQRAADTQQALLAAEKAKEEAARKAAEEERLRKEAEEKRIAAEQKAQELAAELEQRKEDEARRAATLREIQNAKATTKPVVGEVSATTTETQTSTSKPRAGRKWSNSLGMKFVPVGDGPLLFCIWETRLKDFEEYARIARSTGELKWKKPSFQQGLSHPVVGVSWLDAEGFCKWLTETERRKGLIDDIQFYRLPTDTEWSEATGGERPGIYTWGKTWPPPAGTGNYSAICSYDRFETTAPVGQLGSNDLGLFDVAGNVWEMCEPKRGSSQTVCRGGSWQTFSPEQATVAYRMQFPNTDRREDVGFRCVLDTGGN